MNTITLPASRDKNVTPELVEQIRDALATGPVTIDGSSVTRFRPQLRQLLIASRVTTCSTGVALRLKASPALIESARFTGIDANLFEGAHP